MLPTTELVPQEEKDGSETRTLEESPAVIKEYLPSSSEEFPEGGLVAWATVFGSFLVQICGLGYSVSYGVYQEYYTQNYLTNQTSSSISWIGSLNTFLVTAVGLISGALYDKGYFYHLVIGGSILQSFSLFMLSLAKPDQYYQVFLAQGIGSGIAAGLMFVPSMAVISHHFRRKSTLVMTFVLAGGALGCAIHPIMLNYLFNGPLGFANSVRASAALVSGLLLIACLCMRTRLPPPETTVNYTAVAKKCLSEVPFVLMTVGGFLFQIGFYYPFFFYQLDSIQHGLGTTFSFYTLVILNMANLVGRVTSGYIAAWTGVAQLTIASTVASGILILGMIGLNSMASVVVLGVIYGYFSGVYIAMYVPLVATMTTDMSELGARMGICFSICGFGALIGSPISGALLSANYTWWKPALFCGIMSLVGGLVYFSMHLMVSKNKRNAPV